MENRTTYGITDYLIVLFLAQTDPREWRDPDTQKTLVEITVPGRIQEFLKNVGQCLNVPVATIENKIFNRLVTSGLMFEANMQSKEKIHDMLNTNINNLYMDFKLFHIYKKDFAMGIEQSQFLEDLYSGVDKGFIHTWKLDGKQSGFFKKTQDVVDWLKINNCDVFIAPGIRGANLGISNRGGDKDVVSITSLYIDIDYSDPVHKKKNLPPDKASAIKLAKNAGFFPTYIIFTGHGIQAWWIFKEPWVFTDDGERIKAQKLNRKLQLRIKGDAAKNGWDIDSTADLARILRVPETFNCKNGDRIEVKVEECCGVKYNWEDFEDLLQDINDIATVSNNVATIQEITKSVGTIKFNKNVVFSRSLYIAIRDIYPKKFDEVFNRTSHDLTDTSDSGYDMSLAAMANRCSVPMQDIVNMLIDSRRSAGAELKLDNPQYYIRTILNSKKSHEGDRPDEVISTIVAKIDSPAVEKDDQEKLRKALSERLGLKVISFQRYLGTPMTYKLTIEINNEQKHVIFPQIGIFMSYGSFRNTIAEFLKVVPQIKWIKGKSRSDVFEDITSGLLKLCEDIDVDRDQFEDKYIIDSIDDYLENASQLTDEQSIAQKRPFIRDKKWHFYSRDLRQWLGITQNAVISIQGLNLILKENGYETKKYNIHRTDGTQVTIRAWMKI